MADDETVDLQDDEVTGNEFFRIDMIFEPVRFDDEDHVVYGVMRPDPRRYERRTMEDGVSGFFDLYDLVFIPDEVLARSASKLTEVPIYHQPAAISDAREYARTRREHVVHELTGTFPAHTLNDLSAETLEELGQGRHDFAILSVDVVGSTMLSTTNADVHRRVILMLLHELGEIVSLFRGHVLKYTGDGIIAYFAAPSMNSKNDLSVDCALSMRTLLEGAINPALEELGMPHLSLRYGIESGSAAVEIVGTSATKQHFDLIGSTVNFAAKAQATALPDGIRLGQTAARGVHIQYRALMTQVEDARWPYVTADGRPYALFEIGSAGASPNSDHERLTGFAAREISAIEERDAPHR